MNITLNIDGLAILVVAILLVAYAVRKWFR
jgi:UDP-N-acetylmuramyl pentapeptide phosphotransferase/UDP-N-acetylglucosamine-1-phosphate transferase